MLILKSIANKKALLQSHLKKIKHEITIYSVKKKVIKSALNDDDTTIKQ
jgi:hypothetical protein